MTSTAGWRGLRGSVVAVALIAALAVSGQAAAGQGAGDFNGDRRDDLAIGVSGEDVDGVSNAGAVNVIYGRKNGLRAKGNQFWHQGNTGGLETLETLDEFGRALAAGDFDNDGFDDLAIGVPFEDVGSVANAGVVHVLYGSGDGLGIADAQLWSQDGNVEDNPEFRDHFGRALTTGDFNGDGYDDLAIGAPGETNDIGVVHILFGSMDGLTDAHPDISSPGNQLFSQTRLGSDANEEGDFFGNALAAGDFNKDGFDDLAVGVPRENLLDSAGGTISEAGAVNVIYGSDAGLTASGNQLWHQDSPDIEDIAEIGDRFGDALTVGDFDHDGFDDLAVGVPNEDLPGGAGGTIGAAGAVNVIYGSGLGGLNAERNQVWHQDSKGVKEVAEVFDFFGSALAAGDFDKDRFDDLAIGVPRESVRAKDDAGAVNVLYGTAKGLKAKGDQLWHQNKKGIGEKAGVSDFFGAHLAVGRFNKGGHRDLAIGVPGEDLPDGAGGTIEDAGAVNVIYGSRRGLRAKGDQLWHQDRKGVEDSAEETDFFGTALP